MSSSAVSDGPLPEQSEPMVAGQTGSLRRSPGDGHGGLLRGQAPGSRTGSLQRGSQQGSLLRGQNSDGNRRSIQRGAVVTFLTVGRHCERDTRFFAGLFLVLFLFQTVHASYLSYFNGRSHKALSMDNNSGGLKASQVLFPLLQTLCSFPAMLWLGASAWDFCTEGTMDKMRTKQGFITYQVSVVLSTCLYVGYIVFLMVSNIRGYIATIGSEAACYCIDVTDPDLGIPRDTFHCECLVPEEPPWHLATINLSLVDGGALQRLGSNYSGPISTQLYNTSLHQHEDSQAFYPDFKNMVNLLELSLLTVPVRTLSWGWTSEYAWRDMSKLPGSVTSAALQTNLAGLLSHAVYSLGDALDALSLLSYIVQDGRDLTIHRSTTTWVLTSVAITTFLVHLILPLAYVQFYPNYDNVPFPHAASSKLVKFLSSPRCMTVIVSLVSAITNVLLLILRAVVYRNHGGRFAMDLSNAFLLFIFKEFYIAVQKGCEFCIQLWEIRRGI